jgi:hypothetical protein
LITFLIAFNIGFWAMTAWHILALMLDMRHERQRRNSEAFVNDIFTQSENRR